MLREYLTSIANAIRSILGGTAKINAQDFANKIQDVYDKGYEQGKLELLTQSEYMNAKVSGTAIAVNDVSPIEHNVGCYLTSDTITDFSGVEVSRYGKNLCSNIYTDYADTSYKSLYVADEPLIMSLTDKDTSVDVSGCYFGFTVNPDNINKEGYRWVINNGTVQSSKHNAAAQNGKRCPYLIFYPRGEETFNKIMQRWDIQVDCGSASTEFEPYRTPQKITANADGTVEGIKSISPNMTLLTNNSNVVINANYLRDIDTYINNLITDVALTGGN